jgi:hypothetical protein
MNAAKTLPARWLIILLLAISSCDRPECKNTNPILDRFAPDSRQYQDEVAAQIRKAGAQHIRYWFDRYEKKGANEYIIVFAQANSLCAKAYVRVNSWEGIEGLRGPAKGYSGAELGGLRLAFRDGDSQSKLVFNGLDRIID